MTLSQSSTVYPDGTFSSESRPLGEMTFGLLFNTRLSALRNDLQTQPSRCANSERPSGLAHGFAAMATKFGGILGEILHLQAEMIDARRAILFIGLFFSAALID